MYKKCRYFVFLFYVCRAIRHKTKNNTMNTIRTLNLTLLTIGGFVFTYLMGHVIMSILFYLEITDFNISKDMDTVLHFAFGLPILWIQIQIVKFATKLTNDLN